MHRTVASLTFAAALTVAPCLSSHALTQSVARDTSPFVLVEADNPLDMSREETIALPWSAVLRELAAARPGAVRVVDLERGAEILSQVLDADANGQPDSLLFVASFRANERRLFRLEPAAPQGKMNARVHVKFVPEREDVAWESDRIAFRLYGKKLWELENLHTNGIDVWPKRTRALVLDAWYGKGHDGYHVDTGEGADFYQVGPTLGTGGTGVWRGEKLYRGDNFLAHRIIADGPVRAIFEVDYGTIDADGVKVTERKRISVDAGQHLFRQESTFRMEGASEVAIAVGLVKRPGMVGSSSSARPWAWLTGWGPIEPRTRGHGDLGTAVIVDRNTLMYAREIGDHYLSINSVKTNAPLVSYVGAGWTSSRDFDGAEEWWAYVDAFAQRLEKPVVVTVVGARGRSAAGK